MSKVGCYLPPYQDAMCLLSVGKTELMKVKVIEFFKEQRDNALHTVNIGP